MKKLNKKGFTLIELLAVIVILAIILIIAIPSVTGLIDDAKKDSFISTARMMKSSARLYTSTEESVILPSEADHVILITADELDMDNMGNDPDGNAYDTANSYIAIASTTGGTLEYYVTLVSTGTNSRGIYMAEIDNLEKADVFADRAEAGITEVSELSGTIPKPDSEEDTFTIDNIYDGS
ncbi:MAG: prepilin-type N-terminal cleavage/methylation domain-containing protein [Bacilli bacterium]